jgi:hypothetical protein
MNLNSTPRGVWLLPTILLVIATARLPYGYYTVLRIVTCSAGIVLAVLGFRERQSPAWSVLFLGIAVLFNPFMPIHLHRATWLYLNLGSAALFVSHLVWLGRIATLGEGQMNKDRDTMSQVKCGVCGTTNRVPVSPVGSEPLCGKCRSPLPQSTGEKFVRKSLLVKEKIDPIMLVIIGFVISITGFLLLDGSRLPRSPSIKQIVGGHLIFADIEYRYVLIGAVLLICLGIYRLYSTDKTQA